MNQYPRQVSLSGSIAWRRDLLLVVVVALGVACRGEDAVEPSGSVPLPSYAVSVPPSQSFFIPPPTDTAYYIHTGIIVPKGLSARMRISGLVNLDPHPNCPNAGSSWMSWEGNVVNGEVMWLIGPITPGQFANRFGVVSITDGKPDSGVVVWTSDPRDPANGEIIFHRNFGSPVEFCPSIAGPRYIIGGGGHDVKVDFVTVEIVASKTAVAANEAVTFTASPVNFMPPTANDYYWTFLPETNPWAGINIPECQGRSTCTFVPPGRGQMSAAIGLPGPVVTGLSAMISIIKCPTGDPLLDAGLTDELARVMQKSLADPAKKEFEGVVWKDRSTGAIRFQELVPVRQDPLGCWAETVIPRSTSTEQVVATYHAHPRADGEIFSCTDPETGAVINNLTVDNNSWGGGSVWDWEGALKTSADEGSLVPTYVMDFTRIHKLNPVNPAKTSWASNAQHWPRCTTP